MEGKSVQQLYKTFLNVESLEYCNFLEMQQDRAFWIPHSKFWITTDRWLIQGYSIMQITITILKQISKYRHDFIEDYQTILLISTRHLNNIVICMYTSVIIESGI